jgi:tRNA A-37 threonylcarbamoyl transferase component Bud32
MGDAALSTTIVTRTCSPLKALCNFFMTKKLRYSRPMPPGLVIPELPTTNVDDPIPSIPCGADLLASLRYIQDIHNLNMRSVTDTLCRTKRVKNDALVKLVPKGMTLLRPMTCGGMSRIYVVRDETHDTLAVMKITNLCTSLGKFEVFGYELLEQSGIPIPHIYSWDIRAGHLVIAIEKLECTISSLITAIAYHQSHRHLIDNIIEALKHLLSRLHASGISFCDLSPDNIMCRLRGDTLELVLIDPQFAVPQSALGKNIGEQWAKNFDVVHFSLKTQALSVLSNNQMMRFVTRAIVTALVGSEPNIADVRTWLVREIPLGLQGAYAALKKLHRTHFLKDSSRDAG